MVENDTKSSVSRAPPPAPLDLSSVISSEEDHKSVPSQSDVMDILSIASKGSNVINAENLRKVLVCITRLVNIIQCDPSWWEGRDRRRVWETCLCKNTCRSTVDFSSVWALVPY